jgi:hypothetical protein
VIMLYEAKLAIPPLAAAAVLASNIFENLPEAFRTILDLAALGVLFAGFLVLGKLRAQTAAAEGSARAWHDERDAMSDKADRLLLDLAAAREETASLRALNAELQNRPTLDGLVTQIAELRRAVHDVAVRLPYAEKENS